MRETVDGGVGPVPSRRTDLSRPVVHSVAPSVALLLHTVPRTWVFLSPSLSRRLRGPSASSSHGSPGWTAEEESGVVRVGRGRSGVVGEKPRCLDFTDPLPVSRPPSVLPPSVPYLTLLPLLELTGREEGCRFRSVSGKLRFRREGWMNCFLLSFRTLSPGFSVLRTPVRSSEDPEGLSVMSRSLRQCREP